MQRRDFLGSGSGAAALTLAGTAGLSPAARAQNAAGWNKLAFEAKSLADAAKALGAGSAPVESRDLVVQAPEIAENGAVVRVAAQSSIPGTTQIALVVEKNPSALAAVFDIPAGTDASVATNLKMAETSRVYALVRAGDRFYYAAREVRVTLGGCG